MTSFSSAAITVLSDTGALFQPADSGTGVYIGKTASSYDVVVKNRTGGSVNFAIPAINSNITNATAWA